MNLDTFRLFADYNLHANTEMNKILATLKPDAWEKDMGGFYPTIKALCAHVYQADYNWPKRFKSLGPYPSLENEALYQSFPADQGPFRDFQDYVEKRKGLDEFFIRFLGELSEKHLSSTLSYTNLRGEAVSKRLDGLLLHVFNHQTHHRGMVALYLDQMKVVNDFSSLMVLVK